MSSADGAGTMGPNFLLHLGSAYAWSEATWTLGLSLHGLIKLRHTISAGSKTGSTACITWRLVIYKFAFINFFELLQDFIKRDSKYKEEKKRREGEGTRALYHPQPNYIVTPTQGDNLSTPCLANTSTIELADLTS